MKHDIMLNKRIKLDRYCDIMSQCESCRLDKKSRCGKGTHFLTEDVEAMTDDEINKAYNIVFGKGE